MISARIARAASDCWSATTALGPLTCTVQTEHVVLMEDHFRGYNSLPRLSRSYSFVHLPPFARLSVVPIKIVSA